MDRGAQRAGGVKAIVTAPPRIISWNVTTRCPLKCAHCYVDAGEKEASGVLSTSEAFAVIDQICETGKPVVVLSGGEPLMRDDIFTIARHGTDRGLRMVMGSSGYLLDAIAAGRLRDSGIQAVAISLDSANPKMHDSFRGIPGVWERAVQAIRSCQEEGIHVQINMSVMHPDISEVDGVIGIGTNLGVHDYQIFFPVPTGRAQSSLFAGQAECENLIREVLVRYRDAPVNIRPTCAPQFRRIADELGIRNNSWGKGCIAGITYCRIFANGDVTPCPYLPVSAGNVCETPLREIWNHSEVFTRLRDPGQTRGRCRICRYGTVCGGCRARAYRGVRALSSGWCDGLVQPGDPGADIYGEDPFCTYHPEETAG